MVYYVIVTPPQSTERQARYLVKRAGKAIVVKLQDNYYGARRADEWIH
jgi:hypothetical protein